MSSRARWPSNAGFESHVDTPEPISSKTFTLANLLATRAGEKAHDRRVLEGVGYRTAEIDAAFRFKGEADFFRAGDIHHSHRRRRVRIP